MCDADGRITSGLVFVPVKLIVFDEYGNKPSSYELWCWLIELSLAPATIGALARILTNREQEPGREKRKKNSICSMCFWAQENFATC